MVSTIGPILFKTEWDSSVGAATR